MNGIITTLFGQPVEHWARLGRTMDRHGIKTPDELDQRLTAREKRINIYDSINPDRLLGSVPKPDMQGHCVRMCCYSPVSVSCDPRDIPSVSVNYVELTASIKRGPNPLDVKGVLHTYASLKDLMKVRDFRLPGESAEQAERRRYGY